MNKTKFLMFMTEHHDTQEKLAEDMGLPQSAISNRINGKIDFRLQEIQFIVSRYGLDANQTRAIFFDQEVS